MRLNQPTNRSCKHERKEYTRISLRTPLFSHNNNEDDEGDDDDDDDVISRWKSLPLPRYNTVQFRRHTHIHTRTQRHTHTQPFSSAVEERLPLWWWWVASCLLAPLRLVGEEGKIFSLLRPVQSVSPLSPSCRVSPGWLVGWLSELRFPLLHPLALRQFSLVFPSFSRP